MLSADGICRVVLMCLWDATVCAWLLSSIDPPSITNLDPVRAIAALRLGGRHRMWGLASAEHLDSIFPSGRIDRAPSTTNLHHHFHHCSCDCSIDHLPLITTICCITCRSGLFAW